MNEVVDSLKRVTDIMAEILAASQEQTSGIELAERHLQVVSVFRLDNPQRNPAAPARRTANIIRTAALVPPPARQVLAASLRKLRTSGRAA